MRSEVCATLSAVFPLIVIAIVGQRSSLHLTLRRHRLYRASVQAAVSVSLVGLVMVVIGQQLGGFDGAWGLVVWMMFGLDVFCLGLTVIIASVTSEFEEESPTPTP